MLGDDVDSEVKEVARAAAEHDTTFRGHFQEVSRSYFPGHFLASCTMPTHDYFQMATVAFKYMGVAAGCVLFAAWLSPMLSTKFVAYVSIALWFIVLLPNLSL